MLMVILSPLPKFAKDEILLFWASSLFVIWKHRAYDKIGLIYQFTIAKCISKNCKTCKILITDKEFTSSLTNKTYSTRSFDDLTCKSSNVVYGLECSLCGLLYVGEIKGQLNKRMIGHRSEMNHAGNQILYQHFNQPNHFVLSLKVRLLEKIDHPTNSP